MRRVDSLSVCPHFADGTVVTIGNFDGVHLGHRQLIESVVESSQKRKLTSVVLTFFPHPVQVLYPERRLKRLFDLKDLEVQLEKLAVDWLVVQPFTLEFAKTSPRDFIESHLCPKLCPKMLRVGYDFSFGSNRTGSFDQLRDYGHKLGFVVEEVGAVYQNQVPVSSQRIRTALCEGDVVLAKSLLGRPFYRDGVVTRGQGRGKGLGFPTANLSAGELVIPRPGVYATHAQIRNQRYLAVTNVGMAPTVQEDRTEPVIETHLLDFRGNLYGEYLKVEFAGRLRDETKFSSVHQLQDAIHKDILNARRFLQDLKG